MQKNYILVAISLALFLVSGCFECEEIISNRVLVVLDYTDKKILEKVKTDIEKDFKKISNKSFSCEPCSEGYFKVVQIRDGCINKSLISGQYAPMPSDVNCVGVLPEDFEHLKKEIKNTIKKVAQDSILPELERTCLYRPICIALNELMEQKSKESLDKTKVIIYSDMLENSNDKVSLYKLDRITANDFEKILVDEFKIELPDLQGVDMHIINHSSVQDQDKKIKAYNIWKEIFEKHGAKVKPLSSELDL